MVSSSRSLGCIRPDVEQTSREHLSGGPSDTGILGNRVESNLRQDTGRLVGWQCGMYPENRYWVQGTKMQLAASGRKKQTVKSIR
jgi:hypothetical protein